METTQRPRYEFKAIEQRWQQVWAERDLFRTPLADDREPFYYLDMFPYPSGNLHMGHLRNYTIGDVVARYQTMRGKAVLHPMGWDAFGLPAENAAIKNQVHPAEWTHQCIANMRRQFDMVGVGFDWDREIATCEPEYYRWTQWLFLQFYRRGLVVRENSLVNWCTGCLTVLANEQVSADGTCERCGHEVQKQRREQWFFKITDYAQRLLDDLDKLSHWPDRVKTMQRNWIGRSEGVQFQWQVQGSDITFEVFTTRIDTVFGVTFMVLAPEHPLVDKLTAGTAQAEPVKQFVREVLAQDHSVRASTDAPKEGVFTGAYATHPLTGEAVPIWVANYVMMDYGTGAIMAVPAHDERDFAFATKYELAIPPVIVPEGETPDSLELPYIGDGVQANSGQFDGVPNREAMRQIAEWMEAEGIGQRTVNFRIRDWCLSRQRYWGCPIPMVYCETCGVQPVADDALPVLLPTDVQFTGEGNPLATSDSFQQCACPKCGGPARRETDTMDTFVDSSWYFLRFASQPDDAAFNQDEVNRWLPVSQYVGGVEHATMHLIYARFFTKVLYDLGLVNFEEPFGRLFTQGMVYKETFWCPAEKKYYNDRAELTGDDPWLSPKGNPVERQLAKMSKSIGNVVPPEVMCERYGADTGRCYVLFLGPAADDCEWQDDGVPGVFRFLNRVWRTFLDSGVSYDADWAAKLPGAELNDQQRDARRKLHETIAKITSDIERFAFNTAVSAMMEYTNVLAPYIEGLADGGSDVDRLIYSEAADLFGLVMAPFAPHLADEIRATCGHAGTTLDASWPGADTAAMKKDLITIVVQHNGKVRAQLQVAADIGEVEAKAAALSEPKIVELLAGREPKKVIWVPGRLVNVVG